MSPGSQQQQQRGLQLSSYITRFQSMINGADDDQLQRHLDNLYVEYTRMREEVTALCRQLDENTSNNRGSQTDISSRGNQTIRNPIQDDTGRQWPLSDSGDAVMPVNSPTIAQTQDDDVRRWRVCLERLLAEYRTWLVAIYKQYDGQFTPEKLDNMFIDHDARQEATRLLARLSGGIGWMEGHSDPLLDKWEARLEYYGQLIRDLAEFKNLTAGKIWEARPRRVVQETISLHGDAILEFNTAMDDQPVLRFRVSSHILGECSPFFARMFSKHTGAFDDSIPSTDSGQENDVLPAPIQFSDADGSRIQLWRMPQPELNNESALSILLHAAHMHNEHVPRSISFERLVALAVTAIRYRCTKPLELFFEHCWLHQWIHMASDEMPDGLVTISYAFGRRRLFARVTKSVILHLVDEEELRAKSWPTAVKDKIWAVRSAKMSQVYAACSETIEDYLRRPKAKASPRIPASISPVVEQPVVGAESWSWKLSQKVPVFTAAEVTTSSIKRDTWSWRPSSSAVKLPPVGSPSRPISRPIIQPLPPPPPPSKTHIRDTSSSQSRGVSGIFPELFTFSSTPRCPKGSHWCDATNLGWLLLAYNELRLFSAILGPSALNGLSLSSQTTSPPRSLAQVLDALRGMANPPHPVHPGGGVCDPVPAFRDAINDVYNSVTGLALQDVDQQWHRSGLSMPRLHTSEEAIMMSGGQALVQETEGCTPYTPIFTPTYPIQNVSMGPSAGSMALGEENICLSIMRFLDTFETIRTVAILNHRTYNIYKTNEQAILQNLVVAGRRQTMLQLTSHEADELYDYSTDMNTDSSDRGNNGYEKYRPFSQLLLGSNNYSKTSEGASTRAIKRASSEASSDSGASDSEGDWDFEGLKPPRRSRCESLDITEGLGITSHDTTTSVGDPGDDVSDTPDIQKGKHSTPRLSPSLESPPVVIKSSPSSSSMSWLEDDNDSPDPPEYVHHRGRGSSFYSITEQEAYRILWPPEGESVSTQPRGRNSFGMVVACGGGSFSYEDENEVDGENEDPGVNLKYSRDEGWFALQHQRQEGEGADDALEAKSLALLGEGNGNNKLLREEFRRRVGFAL